MRVTKRLTLSILTALAATLTWAGGCFFIDPDTIDYDGDGVPDIRDAFPADPDEHTDTDSDGVGDNADPAPNDPDVTGEEEQPDGTEEDGTDTSNGDTQEPISEATDLPNGDGSSGRR